MADRAEQRITGGMAVGVVGFLEAVDVQGEDGEGLTRDGAQGSIEFAPVLQAGQRIGRRQRRELHGRLVDRVLGANVLEEAADVMADHGHGVKHSSDGTVDGVAKDREDANDTASTTDREPHGVADTQRRGLGGAVPPPLSKRLEVDRRPVRRTRTTSPGPAPTSTARPAASKATAPGDRSEDE